ncbi:MAG TPA: serine O-acetyltransferase [Microbacteriaceae bacterium]|nr:serine O-acetyltransferase [Microbacteriaceae bacterium]
MSVREDIAAVKRRDPAARSSFEIWLLYSGLHAVWGYRFAHWLWTHRAKFLGRLVSQVTRFLTGVEIHPGATIGRRLIIDHGMGIVIGETAEVGDDVLLYHGVTLGNAKAVPGKRHPTIGSRVTIGAGAKIFGPVVIGDDTVIGGNAAVTKSFPAGAILVGVPAKDVSKKPDLADLWTI